LNQSQSRSEVIGSFENPSSEIDSRHERGNLSGLSGLLSKLSTGRNQTQYQQLQQADADADADVDADSLVEGFGHTGANEYSNHSAAMNNQDPDTAVIQANAESSFSGHSTISSARSSEAPESSKEYVVIDGQKIRKGTPMSALLQAQLAKAKEKLQQLNANKQ
jgi:hypothetical protein